MHSERFRRRVLLWARVADPLANEICELCSYLVLHQPRVLESMKKESALAYERLCSAGFGCLTSRFRTIVGTDDTFHGCALNGLEGVFHLRPLQLQAMDGRGGGCSGKDLLRALAYVNDHGLRTSYRLKSVLDQQFNSAAVLPSSSYQFGDGTDR